MIAVAAWLVFANFAQADTFGVGGKRVEAATERGFTGATEPAWAASILTSNSASPPAMILAAQGFDWRRTLLFGVIGGIVGVIVAFVKKRQQRNFDNSDGPGNGG